MRTVSPTKSGTTRQRGGVATWIVAGIAGLAVLGVGAHGVIWSAAANRINQLVDDMIATQGSQGRQITVGGRARQGYPGPPRVILTDVVMTDTASAFQLKMPSITVAPSRLGRGPVTATFDGPINGQVLGEANGEIVADGYVYEWTPGETPLAGLGSGELRGLLLRGEGDDGGSGDVRVPLALIGIEGDQFDRFILSIPPEPGMTVRGRDGQGRPVSLDLGAIDLSATLDADGEPVEIELTIAEARFAGTGQWSGDGAAGPIRFATAKSDEGQLVTFDIDAVTLPEPPAGHPEALGREINDVAFDLLIAGYLPETPDREALIAWRDAGGRLVLAPSGLTWGLVSAEVDADLGLDRQMRPEGVINLSLTGLDRLAGRRGGLPVGAQMIMRQLSGFLEQLPPEDGLSRHRAVVSIANGRLSVGGRPIPWIPIRPVR